MLELFADWEPLPSVASIKAASVVAEPSTEAVHTVTLNTDSLGQQQLTNQPAPPSTESPTTTSHAVSTVSLATAANFLPAKQDTKAVSQLSPAATSVTDIDSQVTEKQLDKPDTQASPQQVSTSEEEGELSEKGELAEPEPKKKRQRGERAGKRVRQRIAKRAREREQQEQLGEGFAQPLHTPSKAQKRDKPTCKYFLFGKCSKGDACPFPHVGQPITGYISCRFFNQGSCQKGDACQYSHDDTIEPCKQLVLHGVCRFGPNCHFSHEPLPAYAVAPLQDWFKEQDQLKLDRSARSAEDAMLLTPDPLDSPDDGAQATGQQLDTADIPQDACPMPDQMPSLVQANSAVPQYATWKDGWKRLYGTRLQGLQSSKVQTQHQGIVDASVAFEPLSGPYTSWQDGWNRLFAKDKANSSQGTT